jgi:acyl-CoA synthetase (AMP-forming)/AMP-acid ligase II
MRYIFLRFSCGMALITRAESAALAAVLGCFIASTALVPVNPPEDRSELVRMVATADANI